MNPRHAAALALVGWYLIAPSFSKQGNWQPNLTAPLSYWAVIQSFDSAKECEDFRTATQKRFGAPPTTPTNAKEAARAGAQYAQCISSDDPRLKQK